LEPPKCFNGELYAIEAGFKESGVDDKVNYGQMIIKSIFKGWFENKFPLKEEEEKEDDKEFRKTLSKEDLKKYEIHLKKQDYLRNFEIARRKKDQIVKFNLPEDTLVIIHHENDMNYQCPVYKQIKGLIRFNSFQILMGLKQMQKFQNGLKNVSEKMKLKVQSLRKFHSRLTPTIQRSYLQ
jgi:hypothetical protein